MVGMSPGKSNVEENDTTNLHVGSQRGGRKPHLWAWGGMDHAPICRRCGTAVMPCIFGIIAPSCWRCDTAARMVVCVRQGEVSRGSTC